MRRPEAFLALALVAAIVGIGCEPAPQRAIRTFDGVFAPRGGFGELQVRAVPIRIVDGTGLVQSVAIAKDPAALEGVRLVPDRPDAIEFHWTGGACDDRVEVTIQGAPGDILLTIRTARSGACRLIGIDRGIELQLSQRVDPTTVSMRVDP